MELKNDAVQKLQCGTKQLHSDAEITSWGKNYRVSRNTELNTFDTPSNSVPKAFAIKVNLNLINFSHKKQVHCSDKQNFIIYKLPSLKLAFL